MTSIVAFETGFVFVLVAALFFTEVSIMFTTPLSWGDIHFFNFIFYLDTFSELVKGKTSIDSRMIFFYFLKLLVTYKIMVQNLDYLLTHKNFENWLLSIAYVTKSSPSISSLSKTFEHHGFKIKMIKESKYGLVLDFYWLNHQFLSVLIGLGSGS